MRNLRVQLLFSHLALSLLMLGVMTGAVLNFARLGGAIDRILRDNYASVIAAQDMKEALERMDSAATFFLAGNAAEARAQYEVNKQEFSRAYTAEIHNITEQGEQGIADSIGRQFSPYRVQIEALLRSAPPTTKAEADQYSRTYFKTLKPGFLRLKNLAHNILTLNEEAINQASERAKEQSRRAISTGISVTAASFFLAIFFALRVIQSALSPLRSLARQAEEIGAGHLNQRIVVKRHDEIGTLANAFNEMSEKLRAAWKKEEARIQRAERISDAALKHLYDPVIVTDAEGKIVHMNKAAEGLFGSEAGAVGKPVRDTISDSRIVESIEGAVQQERVSAEEDEAGYVTLQSGELQRTYRLRATPMRDGDELLGAVAALEDITHLRELDRLKTEFIGVASHELRTPITSLTLSVQLLAEGAVGELTPDQKQVVEAQRADLDRLERVTRDLLDITKLEAGVTPPRFELVPAAELVRGAVEALSSQAASKGVTLKNETPPSLPAVRADRAQIMRVLINLISNALRHTPAGGRVTIHTRFTEGWVVFQVRDTGTGIPREYLSQIFERFVQVPGATGGGAGLGLAIAKTIVEAHGGAITAESEPEKGSDFAFTLPAVIEDKRDGEESEGI